MFFVSALAFKWWATTQAPWHLEIWFEHGGQAFRLDWELEWENNTADIHRDLKVCERQMMEHLFALGHQSFLPAQRSWTEYKASFHLCLRKDFFFSNWHTWKDDHEESVAPVLEHKVLPLAILTHVICMGKSDAKECTDASPQGLLKMQTFS